MDNILPALGFLAVLVGIPLAIYIAVVCLASAAAKPVIKARREKEIEREVRAEVDYANARQRAARKLLDEYDR